jgi:hypothetical protein
MMVLEQQKIILNDNETGKMKRSDENEHKVGHGHNDGH